MDKAFSAIMGGVLVFGLLLLIPGIFLAMTPQPQYSCPICGATFFTYDELYSHFTIGHPTEPIDIIWE